MHGPGGDHDGDDDRHGGVEPLVRPGQEDDGTGSRHPGVGGGVAGRVEQHGPHVEVVAITCKQNGGDAVDEGRDAGEHEHHAAVHAGRILQTANGLDDDHAAHEEDGRRIGLGGEDRRAVVAEGALGVRRPPRQPNGDKGEENGGNIGDRVTRRREQTQGMGHHTAHDEGGGQRHVESQHQAETQLPTHTLKATAATSPTLAGGGR